MYLYFDVNGNLKEIVYYPVREGDVGTNSIYIYVEPEVVTAIDGTYALGTRFTNAKINFRLLDSNISLNNNAIEMSKLTGDDTVQLPYDRKRDLRYFKYGYKYEMWAVTLSNDNMSVTDADGVVTASAYLYNTTEQQALNKFNFNVEDSVTIVPDSTITQSQYSYLYNLYHSEFASEYVPYEGADADINLNSHSISSTISNQDNTKSGGFNLSVDSAGSSIWHGSLSLTSHYVEDNYAKRAVYGAFDIKYTPNTTEPQYQYNLYFPSETGTFATREWIALNYVPLDSSIDVPYAVIYNEDQGAEYLKVGPSDSALYIYRDKFIKEVDGSVNTYNFDATDEGGTFTLATQEWVAGRGYTTNVGTVTSVNNTSPDANGNVTISIPSTSGLVPYTDATSNVNLGQFSLSAYEISATEVSAGSAIIGDGGNTDYLTLDATSIVVYKSSNETDFLFPDTGNIETIATQSWVNTQLPIKGLCATFSTSDFTVQAGGNYAALNIAVSDFIANSDMLIITWDNCFAICPIPQSGPGRVCAAMWNTDGESQVVRIKYELKTNNTLLDVSLSGGFTPPSGHTAYVQCVKLF